MKDNKSMLLTFHRRKSDEYTDSIIRNTYRSRFLQPNIHDLSFIETIINQKTKQMKQLKKYNSFIVVPKDFYSFTKTQVFKQLSQSILQYSDYLLKQERSLCELQSRFQKIGYIYSSIILRRISSNDCTKEQLFFESMIHLISMMLEQIYVLQKYQRVLEELNRIFRTDTFNIIKRRKNQDEIKEKISKVQNKRYGSLIRVSRKKSNNNEQTNNFLLYSKKKSLTKSIRSKSPIISMLCKQQRQKVFSFDVPQRRSISQKQILNLSKSQHIKRPNSQIPVSTITTVNKKHLQYRNLLKSHNKIIK